MTYLGSLPRLGARPHLGSRLSALADGQLSAAETDDALVHVAACPRCADELRAARAAHDLLVATAWTTPPPDPALTSRLLAMRAAPPVRPGDPFAGQTQAVRLSTGPWGGLPGGAPVWAAGSLAGLALVVTVLFLLGARPDVVPVDHSGVPLVLLGDAQPVAALVDLDGLRADGWTVPDPLPSGWTVTAAGVSAGVLEIDLTGPGGAVVVVTQQRGVLGRDLLAALPTTDVVGRTVAVVSYQPWTVVWQAGDTVVGLVVTDGGIDTAETLVAAFPAGDYDDRVPARLARGWTSLASWLR
ncbi:MAG: zf-HC2 domain-containing protein [Micrococcales bacterium]|nr:zf-HC2 domain-containing protein [Micrococcales bacterium]